MRIGVLSVAGVIAGMTVWAPAFASPSNPATIRACLAKQGMTAKTHDATRVDATWRGNSVQVHMLPSHDLAVTFSKIGKAAARNVVQGEDLATFSKVPTKADVARVKKCI
jgi:hypothetical protein